MRKTTFGRCFMAAFVISGTLLAVSCGVPEYIMNPDVRFSRNSGASASNTSTASFQFFIQDDDGTVQDLMEHCYGPSLALFYSINRDSSSDSDVSSSSSFFNSSSKSPYRRSGYLGMALDVSSENYLSDFTYTDSQGLTNRLYLFNKKGFPSSQASFAAPAYVLACNASDRFNGSRITDLHLELSQDAQGANRLELVLDDRAKANYAFQGDQEEGHWYLYRFNGKNFLDPSDSALRNETSSDRQDYAINNQDYSGTYYINVYAAFCIAPVGSSEFNNIYWTEIQYLGNLQLPYTSGT